MPGMSLTINGIPLRGVKFANGTWLQAEEYAYPNGGQTRKGKAVCEDGSVRTVWAGIPDTYFSIPAHTKIKGRYIAGWLTWDNEVLHFYMLKKYGGSFNPLTER